jgi:hypothetical protein
MEQLWHTRRCFTAAYSLKTQVNYPFPYVCFSVADDTSRIEGADYRQEMFGAEDGSAAIGDRPLFAQACSPSLIYRSALIYRLFSSCGS